MRKLLQELDLMHHIIHLFRFDPLELDTLNSDHLAATQIERSINSAELPFADAISDLLSR
jgi:hypothetical protein